MTNPAALAQAMGVWTILGLIAQLIHAFLTGNEEYQDPLLFAQSGLGIPTSISIISTAAIIYPIVFGMEIPDHKIVTPNFFIAAITGIGLSWLIKESFRKML